MGAIGNWMRRRPTATFAAVCLVLVVAVLVVIAGIHADRPTTLAGVTDEAAAGIDMFVDELPVSVIESSTDDTDTLPCPDGSGGHEVSMTRTVITAGSFDRQSWLVTVTDRYAAAGWQVKIKSLDTRAHQRATLVDAHLLIYAITVSDPSVGDRIVFHTVSRCSVAST